jgi:hypothetical protein
MITRGNPIFMRQSLSHNMLWLWVRKKSCALRKFCMRLSTNILGAVLLGLFELLCLAPVRAENRVVEPVGALRPLLGEALAMVPRTNRPPWPGTQSHLRPLAETGANRVGETDRWRVPPATSPDWSGLGRDTGYFLGYQFVAIGVLYIAPESISGWSEEDKANYSFNKWKENVRNPTWDDDAWWINYITHPYWGAAYYIRGRERGLEPMSAFWFSALLSTLFEFGAEALFEQPSYQDLVVTPIAGALIGEYLFAPLRNRIRAKDRLTGSDKTLLFVTDPLGILNAEVDRWLGLNLAWRFGLLGTAQAPGWIDPADAAPPMPPVWGLQLQIVW